MWPAEGWSVSEDRPWGHSPTNESFSSLSFSKCNNSYFHLHDCINYKTAQVSWLQKCFPCWKHHVNETVYILSWLFINQHTKSARLSSGYFSGRMGFSFTDVCCPPCVFTRQPDYKSHRMSWRIATTWFSWIMKQIWRISRGPVIFGCINVKHQSAAAAAGSKLRSFLCVLWCKRWSEFFLRHPPPPLY